MKKYILYSLLLISCLFLNTNVYANEDLIDLKVNKESVSCTGYDCSIEITGDSAEITYTKGENVKSVSPNSGHKVTFDNEHSVQFDVIYQDDTTANYTLTITKHIKSSDNTLKKLIINEEEIELKEEVFVYSFDTKYNDEKVIVSSEANDVNAKCEEKEYEFSLDKSSLRIEYPVTAEDGTVKNYVINLKRKVKPDTTLKTLTLSDIDLEYKTDKLDYEVVIPYSVDTTEIKAVANDKDAKVEILMEEFFKVGENFIEVKVTNKEAVDTYVIKINRMEKVDESLGNLKSLKVKDYNFDFNENVYEYNLVYKEIPTNLNISYATVSEDAKVEILDNENLTDKSIVSIKVSLENGLVKIYRLTLNKEEEKEKSINKTLIVILIAVLIIIMIVLLVLQIKENKNSKKKKSSKKIVKKEKEEEIEII